MTGTRLGPYLLDRELGAGGMGRVYAATVAAPTDCGVHVGGRVAVKLVHAHLLESPDALARFEREVAIGTRVRHENVVRTYAGGALDGAWALVMEYVEGQTLADLLNELGPLPEELCRHVAREMCKGLAAIHATGAIHRDVKPENVLITPEHVVKLMDLGVARSTDDALRLSQTGAFVGSLHYAAPEQFEDGGRGLDARVDLHALGLVLYELATGSAPYLADDIPQTVRRVLSEDPRRLGEINPQCSAFFEEVVHTLLRKRRDERFASADELLAVLESGEESPWWTERARALQLATRRPLRRIRVPRETAVYGRDRELAKLRALYELARAGDGQVVLVEGEAGIGKSRVVDEFVARLQQEGEDVDFLFGSYQPGGASAAAGAFSSAFREHFGPDGSAAYLRQTPLLVPAFDAVLRGDAPPPDAQPLSADSLATCFVQATRAVAAERPAIVLVDDLHFASDESHTLFAALAMALPGHRVLLIGTVRPGAEGAWRGTLARLEHMSHIALERLFPKDLVRLLEDSFHSSQLAHELGVRIALKSDGNPYFVFEIVRGLREGQFITRRDDGTWATTRVIDDIEIPSSILDLVRARVSTLAPAERDLLDVAACCGFEFDPLLVAEVLGIGRIPVLKQLAQIERAHRLVRASGRRFVFDHHQVQEALYASLPELLREEYHGALGDALAARSGAAEADPQTLDGALAVDLAEHYLKGLRGTDALRYLDRAQQALRTAYSLARSVALDEAALAIDGLLRDEARVNVLVRLASCLDDLGRSERWLAVLGEAVEIADRLGEAGVRARAHRALGHGHERLRRNDDALRELELGLVLAREAGDRATESQAQNCRAVVYATSGRLPEAEEAFRALVALREESGDQRALSAALGNLGIALMHLGRVPESIAFQERSLDAARRAGNARAEAAALGNLAHALRAAGRRSEAIPATERSLELCREIGYRRGEALAHSSLAIAFRSTDRLVEARQAREEAARLAREFGDLRMQQDADADHALDLHMCGRVAEACERLETAVAAARESGTGPREVTSLIFLAQALRDLGDDARARACFETAVTRARETSMRDWEASAHVGLADLLADAGDAAGAAAALAACEAIAHDSDLPALRLQIACLRAALPGGDATEALALFGRDAAFLAEYERRAALVCLWRATGDTTHLAAARASLHAAAARLPEEERPAFLANLLTNRTIVAACSALGL